ncbi:MAG: hypothetical protein A2905_00170 [Candidatus Levybacteria bacterium RIFCSPLOWO2_01_FULL_36_10]|nr:MAG: hypothetical protein A2905_00170 [Candidatus Levybacteria bacterium RIFCSPLOWO2_01_FULL_36_10]
MKVKMSLFIVLIVLASAILFSRKLKIIKLESDEFSASYALNYTNISLMSKSTGIIASDFSKYLSGFKYQGSVLVDRSNNAMVLQSGDNINVITNWYKKKLQNLNMTIQKSVKKQTKDNTFNKLVASDGKNQINVEISKRTTEKNTTINIMYISSKI